MRAHVFPQSWLGWMHGRAVTPGLGALPPESVRIRVHGPVTDSVVRDLRVFVRQAPGGVVIIDLREAEGVDQATLERLQAMAETHDGQVRFEGLIPQQRAAEPDTDLDEVLVQEISA